MEVTQQFDPCFIQHVQIPLFQPINWGDSEDDASCLEAMQQHEALMSAKKQPKYIEIKSKEILKLYSKVSWKEQGFWVFHFDLPNCEDAWKKCQELYMANQLEGVIRICLANVARNDSKAIYCFVGPVKDAAHCLKTGQHLIDTFQYQRQQCHLDFSSYVYYKLRNVTNYLHKLPF